MRLWHVRSLRCRQMRSVCDEHDRTVAVGAEHLSAHSVKPLKRAVIRVPVAVIFTAADNGIHRRERRKKVRAARCRRAMMPDAE